MATGLGGDMRHSDREAEQEVGRAMQHKGCTGSQEAAAVSDKLPSGE